MTNSGTATASTVDVNGSKDRQILRELASRYADLAAADFNDQRRSLWRRHNSLKRVERIPIHIRAFAWNERPEAQLLCQNPVLQHMERILRVNLVKATFEDDTVFEPWVLVQAVHHLPGEGIWGPAINWTDNRQHGGAGVHQAPLKDLEDIEKIIPAQHRINEEKSTEQLNLVREAIGDIIDVHLDRAPLYRCPLSDISNNIAELRGLEQIMWDMYDNAEWLHRLLTIMRDGILANMKGAEEAGDWHLCDHDNQCVNYAEELPDPSGDEKPVRLNQLWGRFAAQELTLVGPDQWDEFMLAYQQPLIECFGLSTYGCCEEMIHRIPLLKRIKNLRRIAVTPVSDAPACAELIGDEYVSSYRPSPADMVAYSFDEKRIRTILKRDLQAFKANNCFVDITLKDVETAGGDPERIGKWVALTRQICQEVNG
jgi:hypothetical protein